MSLGRFSHCDCSFFLSKQNLNIYLGQGKKLKTEGMIEGKIVDIILIDDGLKEKEMEL